VKDTCPQRFATLGKLVYGIEDADSAIKAVEDTFKSFGMPTSLKELDIDATDDVCRMLAEKASLNGKKTLGNFRILETEDMFRIYKAAK
jgi:hypothetical protein